MNLLLFSDNAPTMIQFQVVVVLVDVAGIIDVAVHRIMLMVLVVSPPPVVWVVMVPCISLHCRRLVVGNVLMLRFAVLLVAGVLVLVQKVISR